MEHRSPQGQPEASNSVMNCSNGSPKAVLAQYLLEEALTKGREAIATRCSVIRTREIDRRTVLLLLRLRFTIEEHDKKPLLAEEVVVCGFRGFPPDRLGALVLLPVPLGVVR